MGKHNRGAERHRHREDNCPAIRSEKSTGWKAGATVWGGLVFSVMNIFLAVYTICIYNQPWNLNGMKANAGPIMPSTALIYRMQKRVNEEKISFGLEAPPEDEG